MELISYKHIMRGFNAGISMSCVCPTQLESVYWFRRAKELWHIDGFSQSSNNNREILYGPAGDRVSLRFRNILGMDHESWKNFRGMYLLHPDFQQNHMTKSQLHICSEMSHHNERYREKWRA